MSRLVYPHIISREGDVPRIEGTGIKVIMVAEAHIAKGGGASEIQAHFPKLSDAQIYSALAYYYDNKSEIDAEIERRRLLATEMEQKFRSSPGARRLRKIKQEQEDARS